MSPPADEIDGEPRLSTEEKAAIRRIIRNQQHAEWLWSGIRVWAGWISVTVAGFYAAYEAVLKELFHKGPS